MYVVVKTYIWIGRSWIYLYILRYCSVVCIYFSFRWGPFVHSLEIVQWDSTRRDHPGYPRRVSGLGLVNFHNYFRVFLDYMEIPLSQEFIHIYRT